MNTYYKLKMYVPSLFDFLDVYKEDPDNYIKKNCIVFTEALHY